MTDNRTTELREKLDALGIKHFDYDKGGRTQTQWEAPDGKRHFTYETSNNSAKTARLVIAWHPTPEQAIAATLGSDRENELQAALNKAAGNWAKADRLARDIWEQVSHCPDYPIPPCMTESICEQFRNLSDVEQAATLGSGECEFKPFVVEDWSEPNAVRGVCSECSALMYGKDNFCPNCGAKVVRR